MTHPYEKYSGTALWRALEKAVADLESNRDIEVTTARTHIIGFLAESLVAGGLVNSEAVNRGTA